jgi:hypothetical protein
MGRETTWQQPATEPLVGSAPTADPRRRFGDPPSSVLPSSPTFPNVSNPLLLSNAPRSDNLTPTPRQNKPLAGSRHWSGGSADPEDEFEEPRALPSSPELPSARSTKESGLPRSKSTRSIRSTYGAPTKSGIARTKSIKSRPSATSLFSSPAPRPTHPARARSPTKCISEDRSIAQTFKRQIGKTVAWATSTSKNEQPAEKSQDDDESTNSGGEGEDEIEEEF